MELQEASPNLQELYEEDLDYDNLEPEDTADLEESLNSLCVKSQTALLENTNNMNNSKKTKVEVDDFVDAPEDQFQTTTDLTTATASTSEGKQINMPTLSKDSPVKSNKKIQVDIQLEGDSFQCQDPRCANPNHSMGSAISRHQESTSEVRKIITLGKKYNHHLDTDH